MCNGFSRVMQAKMVYKISTSIWVRKSSTLSRPPVKPTSKKTRRHMMWRSGRIALSRSENPTYPSIARSNIQRPTVKLTLNQWCGATTTHRWSLTGSTRATGAQNHYLCWVMMKPATRPWIGVTTSSQPKVSISLVATLSNEPKSRKPTTSESRTTQAISFSMI